MKVNIRMEGTVQSFAIPEDASVFDLKLEIQEKFSDYLAGNQRLLFNGAVLNDYNKLKSYEIGNGDNIEVRYRIVVHGRPNQRGDSDEYELFVQDDNSVGYLKHLLSVKHGLRGVNLKMGNRNLDDGAKLSAYEIGPGSNIRIV